MARVKVKPLPHESRLMITTFDIKLTEREYMKATQVLIQATHRYSNQHGFRKIYSKKHSYI